MNLKKIIVILIKPKKILDIILRTYQNWMKPKLWVLFDKTLKSKNKLKAKKTKEVILIEGFWDNPNHFFRLSLLLKGLYSIENNEIIGLLRNKDDRSKNTLLALGVKEFIYLSETPKTKNDYISASKLLSNVLSHKQLLDLKLPNNFPAYIFYDTALKLKKSPQPKLKSEIWIKSLTEVFRLDRFYQKLFTKRKIKSVIVSHPWKNEFGMLIAMSLKHKIDCYFLYSINEMIRIKRIRNFKDIAKSPYESISYKEFSELPKKTIRSITNAGKEYLIKRGKEINTDINVSKAYATKQNGREFLSKYNIPTDKPIVTVFCHAWYDYPHNFGMKNFTDFLDWIQVTYEVANKNKKVTWVFKPHPTETWYGGVYLKNIIKSQKNIFIINENTSVETVMEVTDSIVTVHGTIAIEATVRKIPVIAADKSYYSDWNFVETMLSRKQYINKLMNINTNKNRITKKMINDASSFAYLSLAPAEKEINIKRLISDHIKPTRIFGDLISILKNEDESISKTSELIGEWVKSETANFCIYHKIKFHNDNSK